MSIKHKSIVGVVVYLSLLFCVILSSLKNNIVCPPVLPDKGGASPAPGAEPLVEKNINDTIENDPILKLEYSRYLKEIVDTLENDPGFKKMIENASVEDIKSGRIASNLDFVHHNVRTKLDELKRKEIDRLRQLISRRAKLNNLQPHDIENMLPKHLDHNNVETFEVGDLELLIKQATSDLEEIDKMKKEEFKQYEIEKEYERRKHLEELDAEARKVAEEAHRKQMEKRKHHEKVNHPGSEDQLKEVWKEEDNLDPDQFNPRTFFKLHDIDGDDFLNPDEIEALFQKELNKIYNQSEEYDPVERAREAENMRIHIMNEIDKNKDSMISLDEFLNATQEREFKKNEEWETLEDKPQFDEKEFEQYSKAHVNMEEHSTIPTPHFEEPKLNQNNQHQQQQQQQQQQPHQQQNQQQAPPPQQAQQQPPHQQQAPPPQQAQQQPPHQQQQQQQHPNQNQHP